VRWLLALVVACSSPTKRVDPWSNDGERPPLKRRVLQPFTLEVIEIESIGNVPKFAALARHLSGELRSAVHRYRGITLTLSEKDFVELKLQFNCLSETPECMAKIARALPADRMLWGTLEGDRVTLHLITADNERVTHWRHDTPINDVGISNLADSALEELVWRTQ